MPKPDTDYPGLQPFHFSFGRYSNCYSISGNIVNYDGISPYRNIITDNYRPEHFGTASNRYVVTYLGVTHIVINASSQCYAVLNLAVLA